jgi:HBS1 N-terminus
MEAGLEAVHAVLGTEEQSGFTDSYIGECLWDCNFDVDETIESLTGMYRAHLFTTGTNPDSSRRGAGENECRAREKR